MSQGSRRLWCFVENDKQPFSVLASIGIVIDNLRELIRAEGVDVPAKDLTLWKMRYL